MKVQIVVLYWVRYKPHLNKRIALKYLVVKNNILIKDE